MLRIVPTRVEISRTLIPLTQIPMMPQVLTLVLYNVVGLQSAT
jgi:hypothetical protein